jgi:hypothetical protein
MKSYPRVGNIILLIMAALLTEVTSGCGQNKATGGVTITEDIFIIHPGTKLRETDERALNDMLKKYDKKLYRIEKIEHGKVTKSIGEFRIDGQLQSELARLGPMDCTVSTDTCILASYDKRSEELTFTEIENAKKLLAEVHPILEKYTRR